MPHPNEVHNALAALAKKIQQNKEAAEAANPDDENPNGGDEDSELGDKAAGRGKQAFPAWDVGSIHGPALAALGNAQNSGQESGGEDGAGNNHEDIFIGIGEAPIKGFGSKTPFGHGKFSGNLGPFGKKEGGHVGLDVDIHWE